ncbi:MAG: alpha/beta hydrolase [Phycisphaerales bacterium]|nr:alpha/beta hydrolase [Phycisphaerales bacterium]
MRRCFRSTSVRLSTLVLSCALLRGGPVGCIFMGHSDDGGLERHAAQVELDEGAYDVSYLVAGDPEAQRIVYVHGTPGSASAFLDYLLEPEPGFEHLTYDRPGFGETTPGDVVTSFASQARALEPLLVKRDGRGTILVGHSLGGPIIAQAAAMFPDRVAGLVILAGSLDPGLEKLRWYNHVADWMLVRWALPRSLRHSNDEVLDARRETELLAPLLPGITCPVTIVHGDRDGLVPVANVDYMQAELTGARVETVIIHGEDHFIPWTQEDVIREAIRDLAARTGATAGP